MSDAYIHVAGLKGLKWDDFTGLLNEHNIDRVVDCRDNPNPQWVAHFRRNSMKDMLESVEGISYRHVRSFGNPKPKDGSQRTRESFRESFQLETQGARSAVMTIIDEIASDHGVCLICQCGDYDLCHLADIVEYLQTEYLARTGQRLRISFLNQTYDVMAHADNFDEEADE